MSSSPLDRMRHIRPYGRVARHSGLKASRVGFSSNQWSADMVEPGHADGDDAERLGCQVAEHCWDPVGLAIAEYAHRFQRLHAVSGQG